MDDLLEHAVEHRHAQVTIEGLRGKAFDLRSKTLANVDGTIVYRVVDGRLARLGIHVGLAQQQAVVTGFQEALHQLLLGSVHDEDLFRCGTVAFTLRNLHEHILLGCIQCGPRDVATMRGDIVAVLLHVALGLRVALLVQFRMKVGQEAGVIADLAGVYIQHGLVVVVDKTYHDSPLLVALAVRTLDDEALLAALFDTECVILFIITLLEHHFDWRAVFTGFRWNFSELDALDKIDVHVPFVHHSVDGTEFLLGILLQVESVSQRFGEE